MILLLISGFIYFLILIFSSKYGEYCSHIIVGLGSLIVIILALIFDDHDINLQTKHDFMLLFVLTILYFLSIKLLYYEPDSNFYLLLIFVIFISYSYFN